MSAQETINTLIEKTGPTFASYIEACVRCGNCAKACHFFEVENDPKLTPIYKLFPLEKVYKRHKAPLSGITRALGLAPAEVTEDEFKEWQELIYDSCTMCGRCTLACPMGIDIAGTISMVRTAMNDGGFVPEGLQAQAIKAKDVGSPLGVTPDVLEDRLEWIADELEIEIPVDEKGADVLLLSSSIELMKYTESIGSMAKILNHAGIKWTFSTKGYEATNFGVLSGDMEVNRAMVQRIVDAVKDIGAKLVIIPECGHALGALRWSGPNVLGRPLGFDVLHISEYIAQLKKEGKLKLGHYDKAMTYHDPCQVSRRGGATQAARDVLEGFATNFTESKSAGVGNWCCGGGGGVISITEHKAVDRRLKSFAIKIEQVDQAKADVLVSACSNCRLSLDGGKAAWGWDKEITNLAEIVAENLIEEE